MSSGDTLTAQGSQPPPILFRTLSGFLCQAWTALLAFVCFPFLIRLLGMEAFGLIGFHLTLQSILRVLDLGLTPTVIRELARAVASREPEAELAQKAGTFETVFAAGGILIAVILMLAAPFLSQHWLRSGQIPVSTVTACLVIMGLQCGVNWLSAFYQSALLGLERQGALYALRAFEATVGYLGALGVVLTGRLDVRLVFGWQLAVASAGLIGYLLIFRRSLPCSVQPFTFRLAQLHQVSGFATGMGAITVLGLILTNMDKVFLSRFLALEQYGNYSLAAYATATLYGVLVTPITNVMFPRLSALATSRADSVGNLYHLTIQMFAVITLPLLLAVILFARDVLELWTGSATIAANAAGPVAWLATGYTLNTLTVGPYLLQIAYGWTAVGVKIAAVLVLVFLPMMFVTTVFFGTSGAAANFAAMNAAYLAIGLKSTHAHILPNDRRSVVVVDIGPSVIICGLALGLALLGHLLSLPTPARLILSAGLVAGAFTLSLVATTKVRLQILTCCVSRVTTAPQAQGKV
jgi:O-antigen/teichoic acid export membrane protein